MVRPEMSFSRHDHFCYDQHLIHLHLYTLYSMKNKKFFNILYYICFNSQDTINENN